jgi:hypothetical protein
MVIEAVLVFLAAASVEVALVAQASQMAKVKCFWALTAKVRLNGLGLERASPLHCCLMSPDVWVTGDD